MKNPIVRGRLTQFGVAMAGIIGAQLLAGTPASASTVSIVYANYYNVFDVSTSEDIFAGATFTEPTADSTIANSTITGCCNYAAGVSQGVVQPVFFNGLPANTPTTSVLYGLTDLGTNPQGDIANLHLVLGVNAAYGSGLVGQDFDTTFAGQTTEHDVIVELLYVAGLDQQYGLPVPPYGGPQTNLLFDFGNYLHGLGGSIDPGDSFSLIAFSQGLAIGAGQQSVSPLGGGPGVPEPSTWALIIVGMGLAGAGLRRRAARA